MNESSGCLASLRSRAAWITDGSLSAVFYLLVLTPFAHAADERLSLDVTCESPTCLVSVSAQPTPLSDIMHELASRTGLEIQVDPTVSHRVMQHFKGLPLESAIQRLAGPHATLFVYENLKGRQQLRKVHIMAREPLHDSQPTQFRSDLPLLDEYGRAWLAAHHDSEPRFLPKASIDAAMSWQNYLAGLSRTQRASLHERMLKLRARRVTAAQLAAGTALSGTAVP